MFEPANILKVVHALLGVWFVAALVGRWVALGQAARATEISRLRGMLAVSDRFEWMVRVAPILVLILGIATAIAQGRPFLGPFQGAAVDWLFASLVIFLSPLPLIPLVFLPKARESEAALEEAAVEGAVTDRLRAALGDRVVWAARAYELGTTLVVLVLMVAKPF